MHQIRLRGVDSPPLQGGVVTIGNFDGIHRGHQKLLLTTLELARTAQVAAIVLTFEPYAEEFFQRSRFNQSKHNDTTKANYARLTSLREKVCLLIEYQIDYVVVLPFNAALAQTAAVDFIDNYLALLQPIHVVIGEDFRFGRQRQGDVNLLVASGQRLGFKVSACSTLTDTTARISSTRVRELLAAGDFTQTKLLLGRPYTMIGRVIRGNQLGRELGFPTANLSLGRHSVAIQGIFAVRVLGLENTIFYGAASIGLRPTVGGTHLVFEVHILDFSQDIYGKWLEIEFWAKLRDEVYYPTLAELKRQIAQDVKNVRLFFS